MKPGLRTPPIRQSTRHRIPRILYTPPNNTVRQLGNPEIHYERAKVDSFVRLPKGYIPRTPEVDPVSTPLNGTPGEQQLERNDACRFMYHSFGKGWRNEKLFEHSHFYTYFSKYARPDLKTCETFEKICFICKRFMFGGSKDKEKSNQGFQCEDGNIDIIFCSIPGCPKVYHRECLLLQPNPCQELFDSEQYVCPRHFCRYCSNPFDCVYCTYCPKTVCQNCGDQVRFLPGVDQRFTCYECVHKIRCEFGDKAPELLF